MVLQDELQWVMEKLELTQQDQNKKVALGRDMKAQLQSLWAELGFVNKQLAALQQQYQEVIGQAGYYKAEQDTLYSQLISPSSLTPVVPALSSSLQKPVQSTQPATVTVLAQLHIWHKSRTLPESPICTVACLLRCCLILCL